MPTQREYRRFGTHYILLNVLSMIPFIPVFVLTFMRAGKGIWDHWTWTGIAVFILGAIVGLVWQHRRGTRMRCPECGKLLIIRERDLEEDDPVNFVCDRCDIEWVTGLRKTEAGD